MRVAGLTASCAVAASQFHKVYFDYNLLNMQSQRLPSVIHEKRLLRAGGHAALFASVVADSATQAREDEQRLTALPAVARVISCGRPDWGRPEGRKLELVRAIKER